MLRLLILIAALAATGAAMAFLARDLLPPGAARMAVGAEGGGYWRIAERYRAILARDGIELILLPTAGSVENASLLASGGADLALLQGGVDVGADVETLGAVFTEPLLVFARTGDGAAVPANAARWRGLRIAAGPDGSGTRAAARVLLDAAGAAGANTSIPSGGAEAADALLSGKADVALFVAPLSAPYLAPLLADPAVALMQLDHVTALSRRMPQSILVDVPSGAFSLDPPLPPRDRRLLGLVARVAAVADLHPAVVDRIVEAAREVHGPGDAVTAAGAFPTMEATTLPQDGYARDLIAEGPGPLAGLLPYWINAQISRVLILALPIVILLLPLLRTLPGLYRWRIRSKVFRHYGRIREIDMETGRTDDPAVLTRLDAELSEIDARIAETTLPLPYRDYAYQARLHVDHLRRRIADARTGS